jgi:hypothetical protein
MVMSFIGFQGLEWLAAPVAGLLATIGAIVALGLVVDLVEGGVAAVRSLVGSRPGAPGRTAKSSIFGDRIGPVEHSLLAREAWWRLRW